MQAEQQLIQRFGLTYYALRSALQSGELSQADGIAMADLMAGLFRDYVQLHVANHQAAVAAYQTEKLLDKVKAK
jgi:hypothetical protein